MNGLTIQPTLRLATRLRQLLILVAVTIISLLSGPAISAAEDLYFETAIRPIFRAHCLDCHGATQDVEGGLDLRQVRLMAVGGDSGPAIDSQSLDKSYFLQRIKTGEMPPGSVKVSPEEIATIEAWLQAGAPTKRPEPEDIPPGIGLTPEERSFWFFQPLTKPTPPEVPGDRITNDIDRFVLARLRENGLDFSPEADRRSLAIRSSFDLTGLPPTQDELNAFLADNSPEAYQRWIDRLLDSPAYGERWGRHWLDIAGYADSEGFNNTDQPRPWAYHYRDYVIRSFNADKPIDRFLLEQLAGDELVEGPLDNLTEEQKELLVATGYLRMAADGTGQTNDEATRNQMVADTVKVVSTSLMGLSFGCAQCHDHRYDPILQEDYYRLRAIFEPALDPQAWRQPAQRRLSLYRQEDRDQAAAIEAEAQEVQAEKTKLQTEFIAEALTKELENYEQPLRDQLRQAYETVAGERTEEQAALLKMYPSVNISPGVLYQYNQAAADKLKEFDAKMAEIRSRKPPERFIRVVNEPANHVPETRLFYRGDHRQPTDVVQPGEPTVLFPNGERPDVPSNAESVDSTGRRLAFAQSLGSGRHTLFNRVFVNRVWMHHFGRGIVPTPAEFGRLGQLPTHPELLDWLACELADLEWSLKSLHRTIMLSTTYRQSSAIREDAIMADQDNQWLWRYPVRRLEAETLRDRILMTSGQLDTTQFGPAVAMVEDETGQVMTGGSGRKSVYLQVRRSQPHAFLQAFDAPLMETNCDRRVHSTNAPQSLMLMNSQFVLDQAKAFADRVAREAGERISDSDLPPNTPTLALASNPWSYGWDASTEPGQVDLQPLPHWTGSAWQGGPELPDATLGWCTLNKSGGHPGSGRPVVRRWTSPVSGAVTIRGSLNHPAEAGDGVRGRIVSSRAGLLGEFVSHKNQIETNLEVMDVQVGEHLDFVVDGQGAVTSDSFHWEVELAVKDAQTIGKWSSSGDFAGPSSPLAKQIAYAWWLAYQRPPTEAEWAHVADWLQERAMLESESPSAAVQAAMVSLCQTLLGSNEFLYTD